MADHLTLGPPRATGSRRSGGNPQPVTPVDRGEHAAELARRLAGLGLPHPGELQTDREGGAEVESNESLLVLVFEGDKPISPTPFPGLSMLPLGETTGNALYVLSSAQARAKFAESLGWYGDASDWSDNKTWAKQLDAVSNIRLYGREDRRDSRLDDLTFQAAEILDVVLWPSSLINSRLRVKTSQRWIDDVAATVLAGSRRDPANREIVRDARPDVAMLRVAADLQLFEALLDHPLVERIRPPLRPRITIADLRGAPLPSAAITATGEPIGVIDDLVMDNPYLTGIVRAHAEFSGSAPFGPPSSHGTQVAGIAAYGDLTALVDPAAGPLPTPHPIFAARVMDQDPNDSRRARVPGPAHLQIERAIRWLHAQKVKVAVCSINDDDADTRALPSELTTMIDQLARETGMVIVVSSGNRSSIDPLHWQDDYPNYLASPEGRIAEPGSAVNAVTVGALARRVDTGKPSHRAIAHTTGWPSPFTRLGPSRGRDNSGTAKPEFAAHGGNWAWDHQFDALGPTNDAALSVVTLAAPGGPGGRIASAVTGTSYAAPYVAHQVARIATRYPAASGNLLRALTALSARKVQRDVIDASIVSVYGEPDAGRILESTPHRVVFVYEGEIELNDSAIHSIPVPEAFLGAGLEQKVAVALAFTPPVRRSRRAYVGASMEVDFLRNYPPAELAEVYRRQPTARDIADPDVLEAAKHALPKNRNRISMDRGSGTLGSNTLILRRGTSNWLADDSDFHVVVTQGTDKWAEVDYPLGGRSQPYALAVEIAVRESAQVDLYAAARALMQPRVRLSI